MNEHDYDQYGAPYSSSEASAHYGASAPASGAPTHVRTGCVPSVNHASQTSLKPPKSAKSAR